MIDDICLSYKGNLLTNEGVRIEFFRMKELWSTQNIPPRKPSSPSCEVLNSDHFSLQYENVIGNIDDIYQSNPLACHSCQ